MKTQEEIEKLAKEEYKDNLHNPFFTAAPMGYIKGYTQCQNDMAKIIEDMWLKYREINMWVEYREITNDEDAWSFKQWLVNSINKQG